MFNLIASGTASSELSDITANLTAIDGMWATIAGIVIGVAAVMVGVKFLKRAGR
jgi:uncharacterized membrane protein YuzA (DUF378 family)